MNVNVVARILFTFPTTVATAGGSFSKFKFIKNYLRTSTVQEMVNYDLLISRFAGRSHARSIYVNIANKCIAYCSKLNAF